jgi:hypothetical protein
MYTFDLTVHRAAARQSLLFDRSLSVEIEPGLRGLVDGWLPRLSSAPGIACDTGGAFIRVAYGAASEMPPLGAAPTMRLGSVAAWVVERTSSVLLSGLHGCSGRVDLVSQHAELFGPIAPSAGAGEDLQSMLTIAAAMLLGRMRRALVHSAAVVAPDGGGWLLVGDAQAGKSTTCVTLITAGWDYLSDDQVVLHPTHDGRSAWLEGWPRPFHIDEGWPSGVPMHRRLAADPASFGPGRWRRTAPLAGLVFPRVEPSARTQLTPLAPADALARLVRQTPWLLADRGAARDVLDLLRGASSRRAYELRLGLDTYANAGRLAQRLRPLEAA